MGERKEGERVEKKKLILVKYVIPLNDDNVKSKKWITTKVAAILFSNIVKIYATDHFAKDKELISNELIRNAEQT